MEDKIKGCMEPGEPTFCVWDDPEYTVEDCDIAKNTDSAESCKEKCIFWSPSQAAQFAKLFPETDTANGSSLTAENAQLRLDLAAAAEEKRLMASQMAGLDAELTRLRLDAGVPIPKSVKYRYMEADIADLQQCLDAAEEALKVAQGERDYIRNLAQQALAEDAKEGM